MTHVYNRIGYIIQNKRHEKFMMCRNCERNNHSCEYEYEKFLSSVNSDWNYIGGKYVNLHSIIKNNCTCCKCRKNNYCEKNLKDTYEKIKQLQKINCQVCRSENGLEKALDKTCTCINTQQYFYVISYYTNIDMNKNECYTIKVFDKKVFDQENNKQGYVTETGIKLDENMSPIAVYTIADTLDDSEIFLQELLKEHKNILNFSRHTLDKFYFGKFQTLFEKIINKHKVENEQKPNVHLTRKKKNKI